jgi:Holliday junction resolvasome RuvABC DNA-binding subunit
MQIKTINCLIREEIVRPAHRDLESLTKEEFKTWIVDLIKEKTIGVGQDVALYALQTVDWNRLYREIHHED